MKPKFDFAPDFASPSRPRATLGRKPWVLILIVLAGPFTLAVVASTRSHPAPIRNTMPWLEPARPALVQPVPGRALNPRNSQRGDHFVMMADPSIDGEMVHAAPEGIDDGMVVPRQGRAGAVPLMRVLPQVEEPEK